MRDCDWGDGCVDLGARAKLRRCVLLIVWCCGVVVVEGDDIGWRAAGGSCLKTATRDSQRQLWLLRCSVVALWLCLCLSCLASLSA